MKTPNPKGYASQSAIHAVCESLKIRKNDRFHDTKWNWQPRKKELRRMNRAALLARL